jgi:RHS repeat-associated protein
VPAVLRGVLPVGVLQDGTHGLAYDQAHRLTSATVADTSTSYDYDGDGQRLRQTTGAITTHFVYDVNQSLPVLLEDGTRKYVWGAGGLAYAVESTGTGTTTVHHSDGLGSVRGLTNRSGTVIQTSEHDEFGVPIQTQGTLQQPLGFTGEPQEPSGLVNLRARVYAPTLGRFLQRDPFGGFLGEPQSQQPYAYAHNNPVNLTDPSGQIALPVAVAAFAAYLPCVAAAGAFVVAVINGIQVWMDQDQDTAIPQRPTTLRPGQHAGESIPARGPGRDFTVEEQQEIDRIGRETGCHTCGTKVPGTKSEHFIPDHQPPSALNPDGTPQQLYPHCLACSRCQGGEVRQAMREIME